MSDRLQWTGSNGDDILAFSGADELIQDFSVQSGHDDVITLTLDHGKRGIILHKGDWVYRGTDGVAWAMLRPSHFIDDKVAAERDRCAGIVRSVATRLNDGGRQWRTVDVVAIIEKAIKEIRGAN